MLESQSPNFWIFIDLILFLTLIYVISTVIKLTHRNAVRLAYLHSYELYFCGHRLSYVLMSGFFVRLCEISPRGFCAATSALAMMSLRYNPTSRIVRGYYKDPEQGTLFHSWVEFRYNHLWYVFDPAWTDNNGIMLRREHYKPREVEIVTVCTYDEFWSLPITQALHERLSNPATSYLFHEIYIAYSWSKGEERLSIPELAGRAELTPDAGRELSEKFALFYDDVCFSQRILNEYMAKPTRRHAKTHTIRRYKAYCKYIRQKRAV